MGLTAFKVKDQDGNEHVVLIENDGGSDVPRPASAQDSITKAATSLEKALKPVTAIAHTVLTTLSAAVPGKITVEFGVELGGKVGIPFVTEGSSKANFKVQVTWDPLKDGTGTSERRSPQPQTGSGEHSATPNAGGMA